MIKGSYAARKLLEKLGIEENEVTLDRMRRFVAGLVQRGIIKGEKENKFYLINNKATEEIYRMIKTGEVVLPPFLASQAKPFRKTKASEDTFLDESCVNDLETVIKFYKQGYMSLTGLSEAILNIIDKKIV